MHSCKNKLEKSYTEKKPEHETSGYLWSLTCSFNATKNKHHFYRERDCIFGDLQEFAMEIISYEEKEMIPLADKENKSYKKQKVCHIYKKESCYDENEKNEFKLYQKVRYHCHCTRKFREAAHSIYNLRYIVPKEIPVVIHNGSTFDYHFIIKQLVEEFKGQFKCLGENTEKYITFSVPIKKDKTNIYKLKFIDSFRFMSISLSNLVDNLSEINKKECKACMERKITKSECNFIGFKNNRLNYRCKECGKKCSKLINKPIKIF